MRGGPLNAIRAGLLHFVDDAGKNDRVLIETLADDSRVDSPWTASGSQLRAAIQGLAARGKMTTLWDGVDKALQSFSAHPATRRLTVISDGHDEGSQHTEEQIIAEAVAKKIPVDAIGVTRSNPVYLKNLEKLAAATGGHFRRAANEQQLEQMVGSGIKRLKSLPLATFETRDVEADGKLHTFKVAWSPAGQKIDASFSGVLPEIKGIWSNIWLWVAAGGAVLLVIALVSFMRKPQASAIAAAIADGAAPVFTPQPAGRTPAAGGFKPAAPRPFVPGAVRPGREPKKVEPEVQARVEAQPAFLKAKTQYAARFEAAPGGPAAWLFCEEGSLSGMEYPVDAAEFWIGSLDNNHLCLAGDPTVSANHACIVTDHGILGIIDHNSTNGTRVNDQVVGDTRQLLRPGDRIRVGRSTFVVQSRQTHMAGV
jgi:hypothetical protein